MNRGSFGTGLWKEIKKEWEILYDNTKFLIGTGNRVSFWKELMVWGGGFLLYFSHTFQLGCPQRGTGELMFRTTMRGEEVGPPASLDLLMIGK